MNKKISPREERVEQILGAHLDKDTLKALGPPDETNKEEYSKALKQSEQMWLNSSTPFQADEEVRVLFPIIPKRLYDDGTRIAINEQQQISKYRAEYLGDQFSEDNFYHLYRWLQEELRQAAKTALIRQYDDKLVKKEVLDLYGLLVALRSKPTSDIIAHFPAFDSISFQSHSSEQRSTAGDFFFSSPTLIRLLVQAIVNDSDLFEFVEALSLNTNPKQLKTTESRLYGQSFSKLGNYLNDCIEVTRQRQILIGRLAEVAFESFEKLLLNGYGNQYDDTDISIYVRDQIKSFEDYERLKQT